MNKKKRLNSIANFCLATLQPFCKTFVFAVQEPSVQHLSNDGDPQHQDDRVHSSQNFKPKVT